MKHLPLALLGSLVFFGCDQPNTMVNDPALKDGTNSVVERDNSAMNMRDRDANAKTPLDQNDNKVDIGSWSKLVPNRIVRYREIA